MSTRWNCKPRRLIYNERAHKHVMAGLRLMKEKTIDPCNDHCVLAAAGSIAQKNIGWKTIALYSTIDFIKAGVTEKHLVPSALTPLVKSYDNIQVRVLANTMSLKAADSQLRNHIGLNAMTEPRHRPKFRNGKGGGTSKSNKRMPKGKELERRLKRTTLYTRRAIVRRKSAASMLSQ